MSFDAAAHRRASLEGWEEAAAGWARRREEMAAFAAPVSQWMLEALDLQPGERVLEIAAGTAETGLLAAELVAPVGSVTISDQAEAMLAAARERAEELGVRNVEFKAMNAEWLDVPLASVDAVICRWGYMLMADPAAALAETRRVLRPGGRVALAVWDKIEANPWALVTAQEMAARTGAPAAPDPRGPFSLGDREALGELLAGGGFAEIRIEAVDLVRRHASFEELWETTLDLSRRFHDAVLSRPAPEIQEIRDSLERAFAPYADGEGAYAVPGRTLVALAFA